MSYEIRQTQFSDPDQKTGLRPNGPANLFVREDDTCPWYFIEDIKSLHKVRKAIEEIGFLEFTRKHCSQVVE